MTPLSDLIIKKISNDGPMPFHNFMDMALYHPGLGYYTSEGEKVGFTGDYFTSCDLTPAFGAMIGKQLEEMWRNMEECPFNIIEYGAGTGRLCYDILSYLQQNPCMYDQLRYCIIEKSPKMKELEIEYLKDGRGIYEKVTWYDSISQIPEAQGCILSNELIDNFPVHRVIMKKELMEIFVDHKNGFTEFLKPASSELKKYFQELQIELPEGYQAEVNLDAKGWMKEIATHFRKGYVLTIDYGYPSSELYGEYKRKGTLTCYHRHHVNNLPYAHIGEQDITSHVNFSALCLDGYRNGLKYCGYTDQEHFLTSLGFVRYLEQTSTYEEPFGAFRKRNFLIHTLLSDMGKKFKVLIQQKGVSEHHLSGLKCH